MKKTIHVYPFFEKAKGLKLTMTLCVFAFSFFISSNAFSQQNHLQVTSFVNDNSSDDDLAVADISQLLQNLDFSNYDAVQGQSALDAELIRLQNSNVISAAEVGFKTEAIGILSVILPEDAPTPNEALSIAYPKLLRIAQSLAISNDDANDFILEIAEVLE